MKPGDEVQFMRPVPARDKRGHAEYAWLTLPRGPYRVLGCWGDRVDLLCESQVWHGRTVPEFAVLHVPRGMVEVVG